MTAIATESRYVVWYRPDRQSPWELVAVIGRQADAYSVMRTSGRRGGDWLTLPQGQEP